MQICMNCKKEMSCTKTGMVFRWNGSHCYRGDVYTCSVCKASVGNVSGSTESYHDPVTHLFEAYTEMP